MLSFIELTEDQWAVLTALENIGEEAANHLNTHCGDMQCITTCILALEYVGETFEKHCKEFGIWEEVLRYLMADRLHGGNIDDTAN